MNFHRIPIYLFYHNRINLSMLFARFFEILQLVQGGDGPPRPSGTPPRRGRTTPPFGHPSKEGNKRRDIPQKFPSYGAMSTT
jgi:hypothetical protein